MTPIERVRSAIGEALGMHLDVSDCGYDDCIDRAARAVLIALREPSEAILQAMRDTVLDHEYSREDELDHWQAMIDAALK